MTKDIYQLAKNLASNIKTEQDLNEFSAILKKLTIEAALNAEMREHLGLISIKIRFQLISVMVVARKLLKVLMAL